jgi:hypothetical protein
MTVLSEIEDSEAIESSVGIPMTVLSEIEDSEALGSSVGIPMTMLSETRYSEVLSKEGKGRTDLSLDEMGT